MNLRNNLKLLCMIALSILNTNNSQLFANSVDDQDARNRASYLFSALSSEFLLTKGYIDLALTNYIKLLDQTKHVEIAERIEEIAVATHRFELAQQVREQWKSYNKTPTPHLNNLLWEQKLLQNDFKYVFEHLATVLTHASDEQRKKIFTALTEIVIRDNSLSSYAVIVNKQATKYPELQESAITDAIYSVLANNKAYTLNALTRIHSSNPQPDNKIISLLGYINSVDDTILDQFFSSLKPEDYQTEWIPLYTDYFINKQLYTKAYHVILNGIKQKPSALLYTQAGYIAAMTNKAESIYNNFFLKAYDMAENQQKSHVATFAAAGAVFNNNLKLGKSWLTKITKNDYDFDKFIMWASIALSEKKDIEFNNYLTKIENLATQNGILFKYQHFINLKIIQAEYSDDAQQAIKDLTKIATQLNQQNNNKELITTIYLVKGNVYANKLKDYQKALQEYNHALSLNPNNPNILNSIGYTLLFFNDATKNKEALTLLQQAHQLDSKSPEILDSLGWAYVLNNNITEGLPLLKKSYELTSITEVGAHLAHALWNSGNKKEALKIINQEWKKNPNDETLLEIIKINNIPIKNIHE